MRARSTDPARRPGRPKGAQNAKTILRRIALEKRTVTEQGRRFRLTTADLLLRVLRGMAMGGDLAAEKLLAEFADRHQPAGNSGGFIVIAGYPGTKEQWLADLKISQDKLWRGTD